MAADKGMIAGMYHCQLCFRDSNGYPKGQDTTPDVVADGTTLSPYKVKGIVEVSAPSLTREVATRRAGQTVLGQRQLGVSDFGTFVLTLSDYDETFHAFVSGSTVDITTASTLAITAPNTRNATLPQLMLLLTLGFQTDAGANEFTTFIWNNVTISPAIPGGNQSGGENPNALAYEVTPTTATRTPMGFLFSATALAVTDDSDMMVAIRASSPISLTTYTDDGVATTFVAGFRPTSSVIDGTVNMFTKEGVDYSGSVSAFSTTTGATTHTAGTAADIHVVTYPTDFVAI